MPVLLVGLVNRTKSWWAGRKGPGLLQSGWDLLRLLRKRRWSATRPRRCFAPGAWVVLVRALAAWRRCSGPWRRCSLRHDFVVFAYTLGLARCS
jgi:formate hydrogenlyase subunit 4